MLVLYIQNPISTVREKFINVCFDIVPKTHIFFRVGQCKIMQGLKLSTNCLYFESQVISLTKNLQPVKI